MTQVSLSACDSVHAWQPNATASMRSIKAHSWDPVDVSAIVSGIVLSSSLVTW